MTDDITIHVKAIREMAHRHSSERHEMESRHHNEYHRYFVKMEREKGAEFVKQVKIEILRTADTEE